jgi:molybdopterin/thiamine biosynthesis adenylyltransferase
VDEQPERGPAPSPSDASRQAVSPDSASSSDARYLRHLIIPELGEPAQEKLRAARVVVVGAGGLGSPCLYYLAAAGVGRLGVVDCGRVELSNLQRQVVHFTSDIGRAKTDSAAEKLTALNPEVEVVRHDILLDPATADALVDAYDIVVAAVDNLEARYALNDACVRGGKALVEGAVFHFTGSVMTILGGSSACYRCLSPKPPEVASGEPEGPLGVFGPLPGVIGALQASEVIKLIAGCGRPLVNRMLWLDVLDMTCDEIEIARQPKCPACGERRASAE